MLPNSVVDHSGNFLPKMNTPDKVQSLLNFIVPSKRGECLKPLVFYRYENRLGLKRFFSFRRDISSHSSEKELKHLLGFETAHLFFSSSNFMLKKCP